MAENLEKVMVKYANANCSITGLPLVNDHLITKHARAVELARKNKLTGETLILLVMTRDHVQQEQPGLLSVCWGGMLPNPKSGFGLTLPLPLTLPLTLTPVAPPLPLQIRCPHLKCITWIARVTYVASQGPASWRAGRGRWQLTCQEPTLAQSMHIR
jgi:hypothetical protein